LFAACATYQDKIQPGFDLARNGQINEAVTHFEKLTQDADSRDRLAYLLEYATVLQMAGRYQESSKVFIEADKLSEQLDYISVSQGAMSALSSEEMIQYKGESFEKIMINAMNALNYIALNDFDSALVEVRRIDEKIKKFQRDNREDYEFNPFGTYLSGMLYESMRNWDDAYIAYLKTAKISNVNNPFLLHDLNRMARLAGRTEQLKKEGLFQENLAVTQLNSDSCSPIKSCGRLNVIFLQGWGPVKKPSPSNPRYPALFRRSSLTKVLSMQFESNITQHRPSVKTQSVYNVQEAAIQTLIADQNALMMRRLVGSVAKEVMADQIRQKDEFLGFIARLLMHLSDRADLRQWALLPETIQVAKVDLPAGDWNLQLTGLNAHLEMSENFETKKVKILPGKTQFIVLRSQK
jgi:hypothetical protein